MKQFAIIGASSFGKQILEELILLDCEIILIDKDPELIDFYKNDVTAAYIADVLNEETVTRLIPPDIDAVVVDLGDRLEASILVTKYLEKLGVTKVIVKAETAQHGEILSIVGAEHVIYPNKEAAKRVTPLLVSDILFSYLPISGGLVMAETGVPEDLAGRSLVDAHVRETKSVNVVAIRRGGLGDWQFVSPAYRFGQDDVLLVVGREDDISIFTGKEMRERRKGFGDLFKRLFGG